MDIRIEGPTEGPSRISMILWGMSGGGKTTLAATMPGKKLWLLFDPDGDMGIRHIPNWDKINLTQANPVDLMRQCTGIDPLGISKLIADYDTVVVDSLTKLAEHALVYAVSMPQASGKNFRASIEAPGMAGYGLRNTYVGMFVSNLVRVTGAQNKHVCFITHERDGEKNDEGVTLSVQMMLGGQLPNLTSKDISEVWHVRDNDGKRHIAIRPEKLRTPMKSRMFDMMDKTSFEWKYNANTQKGDGIQQWWDKFVASKFAKQPLPK